MTIFVGTFVPRVAGLGRRGGLEGAGSIELDAEHIVFRGFERRDALAMTLAGLAATLLTCVVVLWLPPHFMREVDHSSSRGILLVVGLPLLSTFWVVWRGLLRLLPLRSRKVKLPLSSVVSVSLREQSVQLVTGAHELDGNTELVTGDPQAFLDEYQRLRSGKHATYREPPPTHWSVK